MLLKLNSPLPTLAKYIVEFIDSSVLPLKLFSFDLEIAPLIELNNRIALNVTELVAGNLRVYIDAEASNAFPFKTITPASG